jgi:hypothetical protein
MSVTANVVRPSGSTAPPPNVIAPEDVNAAFQILPTNQHPFGADCQIDRRIQSVFFHYSISIPVVKRRDDEEFRKMTEVRMATPGLDSGMWELVETFCPNAIQKFKLKAAIRRLVDDNPMAAVSTKRSASSSAAGVAKKPKTKASSAPAVLENRLVLYEDVSSSDLSEFGDTEEKQRWTAIRRSSLAAAPAYRGHCLPF